MALDFTRGVLGRPKKRPASAEGRRFGLVIGIESYRDERLNLRCAAADARSIYDLMIDPEHGFFPKENVQLLLNEQATLTAIWGALSDLKRASSEADTVWIYFAGHAAPEDSSVFWVTHDADVDDLYKTALDSSRISDAISKLRAQTVVLLLDCCHAAATAVQRHPSRTVLTGQSLLDAHRGYGRIIFAASDRAEKSVELPEVGHGAFTYFLHKGLSGEADADGDGIVSADELWSYLQHKVQEASQKAGNTQTPIRLGEHSHDIALTLNPIVTGKKRALADFVTGLLGLGPEQLSTDEVQFCHKLLQRGASSEGERALVEAMERLQAGQLTHAAFRGFVHQQLAPSESLPLEPSEVQTIPPAAAAEKTRLSDAKTLILRRLPGIEQTRQRDAEEAVTEPYEHVSLGSLEVLAWHPLRQWYRRAMAATGAVLVLALAAYVAMRPSATTLEAAKKNAISILTQSLADPNIDIRIRAISALGKSHDREQCGLLTPHLKSTAAKEVAAAAHALGQLGAAEAVPALTEKLKENPELPARVAISGALARLKADGGKEVLKKAFDAAIASDDQPQAIDAAKLLIETGAYMGSEPKVLLYNYIIRDPLEKLARLELLALANATEVARQMLINSLNGSESKLLQLYAAWHLGRLHVAEDAAPWRKALVDAARSSSAESLRAALLLNSLGLPTDCRQFASAVGSEQKDDIREDAMFALAECYDEEVGLSPTSHDKLVVLDALARQSNLGDGLRAAAAGAVLRLIANSPQMLEMAADGTARKQIENDEVKSAKATLASLQKTIGPELVGPPAGENRKDVAAEEAVALLTAIPSADVIEPMGAALARAKYEDNRAYARFLANGLAGQGNISAALQKLVESLGGEDPEIHYSVASAVQRLLHRKGKEVISNQAIIARLHNLARSKEPRDQVVAVGILFRLGEPEQKELFRYLTNQPPVVIKLAVEFLDTAATKAQLEHLLNERPGDEGVRFAAARGLARRGYSSGNEELRKTIAGGAINGFLAYRALKQVDKTARPPLDLANVFEDGDLQTKLDVLDAAKDLPGEQAVSLLHSAARGHSTAVRIVAAGVAGQLLLQHREPIFRSILMSLRLDPDKLVAAEACAQLWSARKTKLQKPFDPRTTTSPAPRPAHACHLVLAIPVGIKYSVDNGPFQTIEKSNTSITLSAAKIHSLKFLGDEADSAYRKWDTNVSCDQDEPITNQLTRYDQILHDVASRLQKTRDEQGRAQNDLNALHSAENASLVPERLQASIAYWSAVLAEKQEDYIAANASYDEALRMAHNLTLEQRQTAREALKLLRKTKLGRIEVRSQEPGSPSCLIEYIYVLPHSAPNPMKFGGTASRPIQVEAGETARVGNCR